MKVKKLSLIIMIILMVVVSPVDSQEQNIYLNYSKLPIGWSLKKMMRVPDDKVAEFSQQLGGEVNRIDNYILQVEDKKLQINVVQCPTEVEAKKVYKTLLQTKGNKLYCQEKQDKVIEYVCKHKQLIKKENYFCPRLLEKLT